MKFSAVVFIMILFSVDLFARYGNRTSIFNIGTVGGAVSIAVGIFIYWLKNKDK